MSIDKVFLKADRGASFSNILELLSGGVHHFYIIPSLASLTMLDPFFGHHGRLMGPPAPSWTTPMDP